MDRDIKAFLVFVVTVFCGLVIIGAITHHDRIEYSSKLDAIESKTNLTSNMTDKEKMAIIDEKCELYMRGSSSCKYDLYERMITGGRRNDPE